jgi:hypothetical protein
MEIDPTRFIEEKRGSFSMLTSENKAASDYQQDLGAGLIARWSTAADTENIAQLSSLVFREKEEDPLSMYVYAEIYQLMSDRTPIMGPRDYAVVEDTRKAGNPLVAAVCLQYMEWEYDGISFLMSRPEDVVTDAAYRNRGLMRILFELLHARSTAKGCLVEGITGIPYFYRQFGYEYALDLHASYTVNLASIQPLAAGESEAYTLREATLNDLPRLKELYDQQRPGYLVSTHMHENYLQWLLEEEEVSVTSKRNLVLTFVVEDTERQVQGWLTVTGKRRAKNLFIKLACLDRACNMQDMMPAILRALQAYSAEIPAEKPTTPALSGITFYLDQHNPIFEALGKLDSKAQTSDSWYIRVADLPKFIQHIAPALERRLVGSAVANYTGELKLDFYRSGLRLVFDQGHLTTAEHWRSTVLNNSADGGFPPLVFLKALFGYRSLEDLRQAYPDVWVNKIVLFSTLFPTQASWPYPL